MPRKRLAPCSLGLSASAFWKLPIDSSNLFCSSRTSPRLKYASAKLGDCLMIAEKPAAATSSLPSRMAWVAWVKAAGSGVSARGSGSAKNTASTETAAIHLGYGGRSERRRSSAKHRAKVIARTLKFYTRQKLTTAKKNPPATGWQEDGLDLRSR